MDVAVARPPIACTALAARRFSRRVSQIYDEALAPHRLTIGQFGILANLRRSEAVGIAALADRLSTEASTLSRLLKPLAASELISIAPDPEDGRAKAVRLTDSGAVRLRAAAPAWQAAQGRIGELLGAERLSALRFILNDAYQHL